MSDRNPRAAVPARGVAPLRAAAFILALAGASSACSALASARLPLPGRDPERVATPSATEATPPAPPSAALLSAHATLLRLEDRREFDALEIGRLVASDDPRIRARAALTLGRLRSREGAPMLRTLLIDRDGDAASTAAFSLGQLGDSLDAAPLAAALRSAAPEVASEAAYALGKVGGTQARDALATHLETAAPANPVAAVAIGSALLAIWRLPPLADLTPVTRWLASPDPEMRWRAAYALVRRPDRRALHPLRSLTTDEDPRVRAQAVRALTATSADSMGVAHGPLIDLLIARLGDEYEVAINAIRTLAGFREPAAVQALDSQLASGDPHRALAAIEALGRIGTPAASAARTLAATAADVASHQALRAAALDALVQVDTASARMLARAFASASEWRLRAAAARAIASLDGPAAPALAARIADADPRVVAAAVQAAADAADDDPAAVRRMLIRQLGAADVGVRAAALGALGRDPEPSLLPTFLDAYARAGADTLNDAALAAIDAIGAIARVGVPPVRAFLARFPRPDDPLIRQRAMQRLDSAAVLAAWGPPWPIDPGRSLSDYQALVNWLVAPALSGAEGPTVEITTGGGTLRLRLHAGVAPLTAESFLRLAGDGYFDGQVWPRVVPNFVVQGGDPRGDTSGGPGYSIRDEIGLLRYGTGTLGMALAGPDTGGSQFFVTHSPQPHLDGGYAIFGELVSGQEILRRLLPGDPIDSIRNVR